MQFMISDDPEHIDCCHLLARRDAGDPWSLVGIHFMSGGWFLQFETEDGRKACRVEFLEGILGIRKKDFSDPECQESLIESVVEEL